MLYLPAHTTRLADASRPWHMLAHTGKQTRTHNDWQAHRLIRGSVMLRSWEPHKDHHGD